MTLVPIYILAFIFAAFVLFAIAKRVRNPRAKICLRTIGMASRPIFFLVVALFSGWKRQKIYPIEWLTGSSAVAYLGHDIEPGGSGDVVVLKREAGYHHECFEQFVSPDLVRYLESLPAHTVNVQYEVTYDFYKFRARNIETIGDFGRDAASRETISRGWRGGGEKRGANTEAEPCFDW